MIRHDERRPDQLRPLKLTTGLFRHAEGSARIEMGGTVVLCAATVEEPVRPSTHKTAPGSTHYRVATVANRECLWSPG